MGRVLNLLLAACLVGSMCALPAVGQTPAAPAKTPAQAAPKDAPRAERVVVSKEAMTLTVYGPGDKKIVEYPIAAGKNYGNKKKVGDLKTPEGTFEVQKIEDASWWTHDFGDGKGQIEGAYGSHFVRLLTPPHKGIGIHGTHDPASIGTRVTEGCIRLDNKHLLEFVKLVRVGMPVVITGSEKDRAADAK